MNLKNIINVSMPTQKQIVKGVELVVIAYAGTFVATWVSQPDPFSKAAVVASSAAGLAAIYALLKGFFTSL